MSRTTLETLALHTAFAELLELHTRAWGAARVGSLRMVLRVLEAHPELRGMLPPEVAAELQVAA